MLETSIGSLFDSLKYGSSTLKIRRFGGIWTARMRLHSGKGREQEEFVGKGSSLVDAIEELKGCIQKAGVR